MIVWFASCIQCGDIYLWASYNYGFLRVSDAMQVETKDIGPISVYVLGVFIVIFIVAIFVIQFSPWLKPCLDPPERAPADKYDL